jgi:DNA polymerase I
MEFELHPSVTLESGTFSVVTAPEELVLRGLNGTPALSRFLFLYVCGNYSRLLSGIRRRSAHFEVRRAFTLFQLLAILREAHHTILFLEHDPSLYDDAGPLVGEVAEALAEAARTALVVLYAPRPDPSLKALARRADRVFCLEGGGGGGGPGDAARAGRGPARAGRLLPPGSAQTTLEVFGWAGPSRA